ncbi:recombinase family protein [Brevundimonas naejangsanensis]|uniref:recombinase family protein n=1 Tax=Brevundimonas naejangsanensis TaxID=588932 RepID=UPI0026EA594C|nr:recombinase family protein [Brevundimonas naejangsanensis]
MYARFYTDRLEPKSMESQSTQCRIFAERQGWAEADVWSSLPEIASATFDGGEGTS